MPGTRGHHATSTDSQEVPTDNASIEVLIDDAPSEPPPAPAPTVKLLPPSADRDRIEQLLAELRAHHLAYASVAEGWTEAATSRRRELRKLRTDALKQVKVVLIRLGEVEGVSEIEKLSFEHKLERIERYLRA
jgi:transposase InsO family protein